MTNEDIRRSGATTIPEALRGIPGLHVARRNASSWAVSSRAFSSINSEKLLVLSDTRSIYTPLLSGVSWDVQDYLMQDIERIEVIRGPGASLWGANAVNGVINITTKLLDGGFLRYKLSKPSCPVDAAGIRAFTSPFFALRFGELHREGWRLRKNVLRTTDPTVTIEANDLEPNIRQKGVDMRIGLDIASLTLKKQRSGSWSRWATACATVSRNMRIC